MAMVREGARDENTGDIRFESFRIVNRDLSVLSAGNRLNTEFLKHTQVGVRTNQNKNYVVLHYDTLAVLIFKLDLVFAYFNNFPEKEKLQAMLL